ncbi:hypothetical protein [Schinkia azotoformans]|uniref:hypothetical protein n=1 Tax=Schinkia azotoformans TaxID=1454 RepID=UPI002DB7AFB3|nr:hypothetical protein [Schinkia azotoformans]MEC1722101.1 hypothetical protein [Schinkia azotoformans]MED4415194.1 hypothetical protein [Schinkia azotoformans]
MLGEYKVKLSTNTGYSWQVAYPWVKVKNSNPVRTVFTAQDVENWKRGELIKFITFTTAGTLSGLKYLSIATKLANSMLSITDSVLSFQNIIYYETKKESIAPRVGWAVEVKLVDKGMYFQQITTHYNSTNGVEEVRTDTGAYIAWRFG